MKCVVCLKRVPDTGTRIKIDSSGTAIDDTDVEWIVNPYDEFAITEALTHRGSDGEVIILALGPEETTKEIRTALAMGADQGILLQVQRPPTDPLQTAQVLASALKELEFDLLFFGCRGVDDDNCAVGPMVASILDIPLLSDVIQFDVEGSKATVQRETEGGHEIGNMPLPCGITTQKGLNEPKLPSLPGIMKAKKKPLEIRPVELPDSSLEIVEMSFPPDRPPGKIVGEGADAVPELIRVLQEEAKVL
ncbi:MAG: electron transfer flavoprotein subunit beta/FixA family protein [Planctomycetota bacterium]|jgi:electron transfer flavoprotein beta subunit|nr:electron transfer flavoprotein subunit beta/FixA family protein [Planctomycetota bacterium]